MGSAHAASLGSTDVETVEGEGVAERESREEPSSSLHRRQVRNRQHHEDED